MKKKYSDCCIACKELMTLISGVGDIKVCFICTNGKCPRVGLLAVVGVKLVVEEKGVKNGDGKLSGKSIKK